MSMFSRSSFGPPSASPSQPKSKPEDHTSPFEEGEDEYDFDIRDPRFIPSARSRSGSEVFLEQLRGKVEDQEKEKAREEGIEELLSGSGREKTLSERLRARDLAGGEPNLHATSPRHISPSRSSAIKMSHPNSPSNRPTPSPRQHPHHLNALSPLQAFSPLSSTRNIHHALEQGHKPAQPQHIENQSTDTNTSSQRPNSLSRSGSITKSLSRRQSLIASAARWGMGGGDENDIENEYGGASGGDVGGGVFSRLTLVKAPVESSGLKQRSKSSSALAPFSTLSSLPNTPATSSRGPRRSFAASSFAGFSSTPLAAPPPYSPSGPDSLNRISHIQSHTANPDSTVRKLLTPDEVVELARGLSSPVLIPEGGFKGAELKRRKSAGSATGHGRRSGLGLSMSSIDSNSNSLTSSPKFGPTGATTAKSTGTSPEYLPPMALEPVEYIQMDQDVLLPFINRPEEVKELINHHTNEKMFKILSAAFPKFDKRNDWRGYKPEEWSWDEFVAHLVEVDRTELGDYDWVYRSRSAVRARSVALWEKVGTCLGCDGDLLNVGGEDDGPVSWGGLGLGEEGEEVGVVGGQVWIEGIEAERERVEAEMSLREEFGDIVEDEGGLAGAGMTALLGGLAEDDEEGGGGEGGRETAAQKAGRGRMNDPLSSPSAQFHQPLGTQDQNQNQNLKTRSKSFVGLQICTSPNNPRSPRLGTSHGRADRHGHARSTSSGSSTTGRGGGGVASPMDEGSGGVVAFFERGPGSALFPSSFSSLSVGPNLGRKASGAGLSESAITFASESDYAQSAVGGDGHDPHQ